MAVEEGSQYLEKIPERIHRELTRNILRRIWQSLRSGRIWIFLEATTRLKDFSYILSTLQDQKQRS